MPNRDIPDEVTDKLLVDCMNRCCLCPEHHDVVDRHHTVYIRDGGPNTEENLVAVCPTCHAKIHRIPGRYNADQLRMYKARWVRQCAQGLPLDYRIAQASDVTRPPPQAAPAMSLPPGPYFAHPYLMPANWIGRAQEKADLDAWLAEEQTPVCCLVAHGGTGKSGLAWKWLECSVAPNQAKLGIDGIFQWSFYEGEVSFQRFLEELSAYLGLTDKGDPVSSIVQRLSERRFLLVLDGFERLLCEYASPEPGLREDRPAEELEVGQRRCVELRTSRFLRSVAAGAKSKALLTSRLVPEELDDRDGWLRMPLLGLAAEDAIRFLKSCGIRGTDRQLQIAAEDYACHPLSLARLVNALRYDPQNPNDIDQASNYDVSGDLTARQHHILERAYNTLPENLQRFLGALSALRGRPTTAIAKFLAGDCAAAQLSGMLRRLEEDLWIQYERDEGTLYIHPLVRRFVYIQLADKQGVHTRLVEYFRPLADAVNTLSAESVAELAPVIELYHHTVQGGQYDEALNLFCDHLHDPLYYRFAAYLQCIELLRALFREGEDRPPRLQDESDQAWTLNALANCHSRSGQPRRAAPLYEISNGIERTRGDKHNLAVVLVNLAYQKADLGNLATAEQSLRRSIDLAREMRNEFGEAVGRQDLGKLLAHRGAFDKSGSELACAFQAFGRLGQANSQCVVSAYRSICALLMGDAQPALDASRNALHLAEEAARAGYPVERSFVRAHWLIGASLTAFVQKSKADKKKLLTKAGTHLMKALTRCRGSNMVDLEPDILLSCARWHRAMADVKAARDAADEALHIADRCEYRLSQADIHNFVALLDLEAGKTQDAIDHARIGRERAWCDGPPHCYKPALDEADRLLKELRAESAD